MTDTFTGWTEDFPRLRSLRRWLKKKKKLLHEIILRFGLSKSLQSDNGTSFPSKVTQGVSKALGIIYYFHCTWRPQSSEKVEKSQPILKISDKKDNLGDLSHMEEGFTNSSPPHHIAPKEQVGLSPYEMLYWRPFVYVSDLFLDP